MPRQMQVSETRFRINSTSHISSVVLGTPMRLSPLMSVVKVVPEVDALGKIGGIQDREGPALVSCRSFG